MSEKEPRIPWAKPALAGREREFLLDAIESTWISDGPYVEAFQSELSRFLDVDYVSVCSNGTTAIELALLSLERSDRKEVIVPAYGYLAAANAALRLGFSVVFADVDPRTWNLTPESVRGSISPKTLCVIAIHTYGSMCDIPGISAVCAPFGVVVVEDSAEAFGSKWAGRQAGTLGLIGTLSFQATKTITTGEGGAVCTDDKDLFDRLQLFRSHGVRETKYLHAVPGGNSRITNMQAAVGLAQMAKVDFFIDERVRIHSLYRDTLSSSDEFTFQESESDCEPVFWATGVLLAPHWSEEERDTVIKLMEAAYNIECRPGFYSAFRHGYFAAPLSPFAEVLANRVVVLPGFVGMSEFEVRRVSETFLKALASVWKDS